MAGVIVAMVDDPDAVLSAAVAKQKITQTIILQIYTDPAASVVGGGLANTADHTENSRRTMNVLHRIAIRFAVPALLLLLAAAWCRDQRCERNGPNPFRGHTMRT
jgi:hypothetical protein